MFKTIVFAVTAMSLISCTSKDSVKKLLKENPDILVEAIDANAEAVITALTNANRKAQESMQKAQAEQESKALEESFEKPLEPVISEDAIKGPKDAPLTLVIYSDFECPYCGRGFKNEKEVLAKYDGKIRKVFKHLPLPMHPQAMIAAQYYEAVRLQGAEKAEKFHDSIFTNQGKLQEGEAYLKTLAKSLGVDMGKLSKDVKSDTVKNRINADMEEANKFGFQGTPGYLLNGVPIRGAYPPAKFDEIVEKLKEKGKVKL